MTAVMLTTQCVALIKHVSGCGQTAKRAPRTLRSKRARPCCGCAGDSFTFVSGPCTTQSSGFARHSTSAIPTSPQPQAPPRVIGELSHLFEGTTRRGKPRGLSTLSAPAAVAPRGDQGTLGLGCPSPLTWP